MNSWHRLKKGTRDEDMEMQVSKTDGDDSGRKRTRIERILKPKEPLPHWWNMMFAVSCVIAVSVDPLFFYIPIINGDNKCLSTDRRLKITAYILRFVTDFIYVLNIILQSICPYIDEDSRKLGRIVVVRDRWQIAHRYFFSRLFIIDVLAILPLPQVIFPIIFSEMRESKFLDKRKLLNAVVFFQYVPRVIRIYISWVNLSRTASKLARIVWVKAAFNFFLYILSSHVLGAFWYLFSIQRETACWHTACEKHAECTSISFNCKHHFSDRKFLKNWCSIETPNTIGLDLGTSNTTGFDFGIFLVALQSRNLESTDFPRKLSYCFWWGLRNLSSFGQNLQTSSYFWENCFAISVSIIALMLFLYFIGNVQTYRQLATERSEEIIQNMKVKEREIDLWIDRNQLSKCIKQEIMSIVQHMLKEKKDVDVQNLLSYLPKELERKIKRHICLPLLKKVPQLEGKGDQLLQLICDSLKPLYYNEDSYILREGEPLTAMLFITQGSVCCFKTSNGENGEGTVSGAQCIEKGEFYGEKLLEWRQFNDSPSPGLSDLPISTKTVKTLTKVEAFALTANNLKILVARHSQAISNAKVKFTQAARRHLKEKSGALSVLQVQGPSSATR